MLNDFSPLVAADTDFRGRLAEDGLTLERDAPRVLQLNVGRLCNLTCVHCHVNAGPKRREIMPRRTIEKILGWLDGKPIETVDLTGGAPEMIPDFHYLVRELVTSGRHVIDRCNLTVLLEPGYEGTAEFMADHGVEIVASMPCYAPENVTAQRGEGVFDASIEALRKLNALGYGLEESLPLHLVYNPNGAKLPPEQEALEADYKRELLRHFGIRFNRLYALANLPVARFASWLKRNGRLESYMRLLVENFNPATVSGLMCRDTISVDWRGEVYDCDFNQQCGMRLAGSGDEAPYLWDLDLDAFRETPIRTAPHCFGCTAGAGSSCGGSLAG